MLGLLLIFLARSEDGYTRARRFISQDININRKSDEAKKYLEQVKKLFHNHKLTKKQSEKLFNLHKDLFVQTGRRVINIKGYHMLNIHDWTRLASRNLVFFSYNVLMMKLEFSNFFDEVQNSYFNLIGYTPPPEIHNEFEYMDDYTIAEIYSDDLSGFFSFSH